jgi:hypothetical protein
VLHDSQSRYRVNNCRETLFPHIGKTKKLLYFSLPYRFDRVKLVLPHQAALPRRVSHDERRFDDADACRDVSLREFRIVTRRLFGRRTTINWAIGMNFGRLSNASFPCIAAPSACCDAKEYRKECAKWCAPGACTGRLRGLVCSA